ncbi:MAG: hypothetical protein WAJ86_15730, partial [Candidatus Acidiferrales bacterium]
PDGVYTSQFDLREKNPPQFYFVADAPLDDYILRAMTMPNVQLFWQFSRFPVIRSYAEDGVHIVELGENRSTNSRRRGPQPFTYRVIFDGAGRVIDQGWLTEGMPGREMQHLEPQEPGAPEKNAP